MTEKDQHQSADWQNDQPENPGSEDELEWLNEPSSEAGTSDPDATVIARRDQPEPSADEPSEPEGAQGVDAANEGIPEWLRQLGPHYAQPETLPTFPPGAGDDTGIIEEFTHDAAQPVSDDEMPDWSSVAGVAAAASSAEAAGEQADDEDEDYDWLNEPEPEVEPEPEAPFGSLLDLKPLEPENLQKPPEAPAEDEQEFEWLSEEAQASAGVTPPVSQAEAADWLEDLAPEGETPQAASVESEAEGEFEWLSQSDEEGAAVVPPVSAIETEEWLNRIDEDVSEEAEPVAPAEGGEQAEPAVMQESEAAVASATEDEDGFEWIAEISEEAEEQPAPSDAAPGWIADVEKPSVPAGEPAKTRLLDDFSDEEIAWLESGAEESEAEPAASLPESQSADPYRFEEAAASEEPDWLGSILDAQHEPAAATGGDFDWLQELEAEGDDAEAAGMMEEHAPAENAPDWLNAMVPGIDLDYEASEDAPIEQEFAPVQPAASASPTREFDWLLNIVEEETSIAEPVAAAEAVEQPTERQPRFVFSQPPAWLRQYGQTGNGAPDGTGAAV